MRTDSFRTIPMWACLALALCAGLAGAADPMPAKQAADKEPASARAADDTVREVQPPVLYLRSKEGGLLQAVLGFTLEDFERFMAQRAQLGLGARPPKFQLEKLAAHGRAGDAYAQLSIQLSLIVNDRAWVRIPLRMPEAILRGKAQYHGPSEHLIEVDATTGEHILWLRGQGDTPHHITLDVAVPVATRADETELKLSLPRAAVSELKLLVIDPTAVATLPEDVVLESTRHSENGTEFTVLGAARDFSITWRKPGDEVAPEPPARLEAVGAVDVTIDSHGVHSDVELMVRGFSPRFEGFRFQLPAQTTLVADDQPGYAIEPVREDAPGDSPEPRLFEVTVREKVAGPLVIRFSTDRPHAQADADAGRPVEISGVQLLGAARQSGHVAVQVDDDWQIAWGELRQARQVDELPTPLDHAGVVAGFEYFGQPFAIEGRMVPRESHVTVEPKYTVSVEAGQLRLEARLRYRVRGAKIFAVDVALSGWTLDDVEPRNVFDADRIVVDGTKPQRFPLVQPATGDLELVLRAHRELAADAAQIAFDLPRPTAHAWAPARLSIAPDDNVSLTVRDASLLGLVRQRTAGNGGAATGAKLAARPALVFRGDGKELHFEADLHVERRQLWAEAHTRLKLDEQSIQAEETIDLSVLNEAIDQIVLDVPQALVDSSSLKVRVDGQPITPVPVEGEPSESAEGTRSVKLPLAEPRLGKCQIVVSYPVDADRLAPGVGVPVSVPLVMPAGAEVAANVVSIVSGPGIQVQSRDDAWRVDPPPGAGAAPLRLSTSQARGEVLLAAHLDERDADDPAVIERAWLQTRLAGGERWERAVYQFTGGGSRIQLALPAGASAAETQFVLDGAAIKPDRAAGSTAFVLALPSARRRHVLDVSYRIPTRAMQPGALSIMAPELGDDLWIRQMYWQLVLPRGEHLLWWPANLSGEFRWRLRGFAWGREPTVEQPQLESWADAQHLADVPDETNRYVFSAVGPIDTLEVRTGSRTMLVLGASGLMLAAGILLIYVRALRTPATLIIVGILLLAAAILWPGPAVLLVQAALLGVALTLGVVVLRRLFDRRPSGPLLVRAGTSSIVEPGSTRTHQRPHGSAAPATPAEATPLVPQMSAPEGDA